MHSKHLAPIRDDRTANTSTVAERVVDVLTKARVLKRVEAAAKPFGVTVREAFSSGLKVHAHALVRMWVYRELRDLGLTWPAIGDLCGVDHSTPIKVLARATRLRGAA